jgi:hypothetical protein
MPTHSPYKFEHGFPAAGTAERAYDADDLRRAIEAYKFFYLTVSTEAVMQQGQADVDAPPRPTQEVLPFRAPGR